jgi:UDP-2-acetamido-3-amino-2,3-dideoxy-glucuronate N-acetyltransferase
MEDRSKAYFRNKKSRNIAVVGCGYWGKNLVRNFAGLGALKTVCDANPSVLEQIASDYPSVKTEADYHRVLRDEEVKGVVISTPAVLHYPIAREIIIAGKDVFVEKPLALKIEEGKELVKLAEERKRILMVGHLLEYHPAIEILKGLVDRGELGKIRYIYSNRLNLGKFRTEENILWSFAPHDISVILRLVGGEMPQDVSAHGGVYLQEDIADVTLTTMSFKDGVRAHIFVSWLHPFKEQRLVVVGEKKMVEFNDTNPKDKLRLFNYEIEWIERRPVPRQMEPEVIAVPKDEPLKLECLDFLDCVETRRRPKVDGYKGLQVLEILSYCQKSLQANGAVISTKKINKCEGVLQESSIVEEPYEIGEGTKIWHFSHLMPNVTLGKNCVVGQNVFIGKGVKIGNNVKIENNVSVYEAVTLEDDVFCGPSCVFTNVINPRSHISRKHEFKPTLVKKGATIGANATIICGHTIGKYAFIGAGAAVTRDVLDYALVYGNPARIHGWVCECNLKLDFKGGSEAVCSRCALRYRKHEAEGMAWVERIDHEDTTG